MNLYYNLISYKKIIFCFKFNILIIIIIFNLKKIFFYVESSKSFNKEKLCFFDK